MPAGAGRTKTACQASSSALLLLLPAPLPAAAPASLLATRRAASTLAPLALLPRPPASDSQAIWGPAAAWWGLGGLAAAVAAGTAARTAADGHSSSSSSSSPPGGAPGQPPSLLAGAAGGPRAAPGAEGGAISDLAESAVWSSLLAPLMYFVYGRWVGRRARHVPCSMCRGRLAPPALAFNRTPRPCLDGAARAGACRQGPGTPCCRRQLLRRRTCSPGGCSRRLLSGAMAQPRSAAGHEDHTPARVRWACWGERPQWLHS